METVTITIDVNGEALTRTLTAKDEDVMQDIDFWGQEVVDMFKTIEESKNHNF